MPRPPSRPRSSARTRRRRGRASSTDRAGPARGPSLEACVAVYETARARRAAVASLPVLLALPAAWLFGDPAVATAPLVGLAAGLVGWALYRGEGYEEGVRPGLAFGLAPLVAAALLQPVASTCGTALCSPVCLLIAALGTAWGTTTAFDRVAKRKRGRYRPALVSLALAVTLSPLGCSVLGLGSLVGVGLGFLVGLSEGSLRALRRARAELG